MFSRTLAVTVTVAAMLLTACDAQSQAQAQQFNLVCEGRSTVTQLSDNQPMTEPSKFDPIFRIDLAAGKWCFGECEEIKTIVEANDNRLILSQRADAQQQSSIIVNRMTGAMYSSYKDGCSYYEASAKCQRRPFTGITPKF